MKFNFIAHDNQSLLINNDIVYYLPGARVGLVAMETKSSQALMKWRQKKISKTIQEIRIINQLRSPRTFTMKLLFP